MWPRCQLCVLFFFVRLWVCACVSAGRGLRRKRREKFVTWKFHPVFMNGCAYDTAFINKVNWRPRGSRLAWDPAALPFLWWILLLLLFAGSQEGFQQRSRMWIAQTPLIWLVWEGGGGGLAIPVIFAWWQGHTDCREPHSRWTWRSERRSLPPRGSVSRSSPDSCCSTNYGERSVHGPTRHTITHTLTHNHTHSADPETRRRLNSDGPLCGSLQGLKHSHEERKRWVKAGKPAHTHTQTLRAHTQNQ